MVSLHIHVYVHMLTYVPINKKEERGEKRREEGRGKLMDETESNIFRGRTGK